MKIDDLFFGSHLDDSGLLSDVTKSGDKAGQELGRRIGLGMSTALSVGSKVAFAALAGGAAIAVRGLAELDSITAKFRADTGASADEAERAGKAINEMAGRNLQPMDEIGGALTKVYTDLHLTGDEAVKTTEAVLKYATATGQNAVDAVGQLANVLHAWNLTAEQSQHVMDLLVASHQKYGGSIADNQEALQRLAPQLQALNLNIDDAVGLLNLFTTAGLDSAKAQAALNTAVKNLKPGQSFNDLIKEISSIEDPTKRAQKAIELFGAKGGVALANALRPGVDSLKTFEVSATDAAGATQKASDAIENDFGNRVKLAIKAIGSEIIGLGQDFGPVLSGLAGLAAVAGDLGLGKALSKGWSAVASSGAVRAAATEAGAVLGALYGAAAGATEQIVGLVKDAWHELAGSAAVKAAASEAGAIVGAIYGTAAKFAETIADGVTAAFVKLPFAPQVRSAVLAASIELGTLEGTAVGGAILAAFAAAPLVIPLLLVPTLQHLAPDITGKDIQNGIDKAAQDLISGRVVAITPEQAHNVEGPGAVIGQKAGDAMVAAWKASSSGMADVARNDVAVSTAAMAAAWKRGAPQVRAAVDEFQGKIADDLSGVKFADIARRGALLLMGKWAQGFRDGRDAVDTAWQDMLDGLKHPISVTAETAKLLGELASKKLIAGMHSGDPAVKDQANYTKQLIIDRLLELQPRVGTLTKAAMNELKTAMKSKDPDIRAAATAIYNAATHPLSTAPASAYKWGEGIATNLAAGLAHKAVIVESEARRLGGVLSDYLRVNSPAKLGPLSEGGGPGGWAERFTWLIADGMTRNVHRVAAASRLVANAAAVTHAGVVMPGIPQPFLNGIVADHPGIAEASTLQAVHGGDVTIGAVNLYGIGSDVSPAAARRFGQRVQDEIATTFRQQGARVGIHPKVVP